MAVPGDTPISPVTVMLVAPVLVTVEAPRTRKLWALPSDSGAGGAAGAAGAAGGAVQAVIVFVSIVTAAVRANALPFTVAPVVSVMLACAIMFPISVVVVPRVAELPTCQYRFDGQLVPPLLIRATDEP